MVSGTGGYTQCGMTSFGGQKKCRHAWGSAAVGLVIAAFAMLSSHPTHSEQAAKQTAGAKSSAAGTPSGAVNPFDRYLAETKANRPEEALVRFAKTCGMDVSASAPRFAERPGEHWLIVTSLSGAPKSEETDYYHTLEVWEAGKHVVTEEWGIAADSGDYYRVFACLLGRQVTSAELVSWNIPDEVDSGDSAGWGCDIRWELRAGGKFERTLTVFLDLEERPIPEPKMDADLMKELDDQDFDKHTWTELGYPMALLK